MNVAFCLLPLLACVFVFTPILDAAKKSCSTGGVTYHRPARLKTSDLTGFKKLPESRQKLISAALDTANKNKWLKYKFGGANPSVGGFDCSGAMYYVLRGSGYKPPRTSAQQYV
ncbi:MAG: NlpC/P60 family protein [Akkermansiaceae bacterium]|jgi:cell wall-associated NlpC family hydrolase|tara:strand:- start:2290 stop:2631 length:342 start_codon:yes stop_codon:yes gene_type:complete